MKKFFLFIASFVLSSVVLQVLSGWVLTLLYKPRSEFNDTASMQSYVEFGSPTVWPTLVIATAAAGMAFFATRWLNKKMIS